MATENMEENNDVHVPAEYYKDVILLPSLTWMKVPNDKSQLQKRGCYVDAVRF